jgi:hypothetical protein
LAFHSEREADHSPHLLTLLLMSTRN